MDGEVANLHQNAHRKLREEPPNKVPSPPPPYPSDTQFETVNQPPLHFAIIISPKLLLIEKHFWIIDVGENFNWKRVYKKWSSYHNFKWIEEIKGESNDKKLVR